MPLEKTLTACKQLRVRIEKKVPAAPWDMLEAPTQPTPGRTDMNTGLKFKVNDAWMAAAAQIAAAQVQNDPILGSPENLPRTIHKAYYAIWLANRRLEDGVPLDQQ